MKKIFALAAVMTMVTGCAVTREGVRVGAGAPPSQSEVDKIRSQVQQNAQSAAAKKVVAGALASEMKAGVIVVGEAGPLRKLDEAARRESYKSYVATAGQWHPGQAPVLSEADFVTQIAGWSTMQTFSIPGVMKLTQPALVRADDIIAIGFASTAASFLIGTTGDLVGAQSNADGMLIIDKILCKDSAPDYRACAREFAKGRFDINGGQELDRDMKPKSGGVRIDPSSYKVIPVAG